MQQKPTSPLNAFLPGKLRQAADNNARLMDMVNRLTQIAYEKGTRKGDIAVRERLKAVVGEAEAYYRALRLFASGKSGETDAYKEMLDFFNVRLLERSAMTSHIEALKAEIGNQEALDREHNVAHASEGYVRKTNIFVKNFENELAEWEKYLLYHVDPKLRRVLHDINEIVLYFGIDKRFLKLITNDDVFTRSGHHYIEFKKCIAYYTQIHIKLTRMALSDADLKDMINRILQQMGFRNQIMRTRNINQDVYNEMLTEIINEGHLREYADRYAGTSREALDAIREHEKKREGRTPDAKDAFKTLEDLCGLEDSVKRGGGNAARGLARNEADRFLFHTPGASEYTLKTVSEYLRDSHIFVVDWCNRELQKTPSLSGFLKPLLECIPAMNEFIQLYAAAIGVSMEKSNQAPPSFLSGERHYIPKRLAGDLIESIRKNCDMVRSALIELSYSANGSPHNRSGVLTKKIDILKESCSSSCAKVSKGISEMDRK